MAYVTFNTSIKTATGITRVEFGSAMPNMARLINDLFIYSKVH